MLGILIWLNCLNIIELWHFNWISIVCQNVGWKSIRIDELHLTRYVLFIKLIHLLLLFPVSFLLLTILWIVLFLWETFKAWILMMIIEVEITLIIHAIVRMIKLILFRISNMLRHSIVLMRLHLMKGLKIRQNRVYVTIPLDCNFIIFVNNHSLQNWVQECLLLRCKLNLLRILCLAKIVCILGRAFDDLKEQIDCVIVFFLK